MNRFTYRLLLWALLPFVLFRLFLRGRMEPGYRKHIAERFGFYPPQPQGGPVIWVHAVSVGETRAAQPIIEGLLKSHPGHRILLTHMTPTGRKTGEALYSGRATIVYLPYDYPFAVRRFLAHFRPVCGILMETEIWFNLVAECRHLPLFLANARLSEKSMKSYSRAKSLTRESLSAITVLAQTADDRERFLALGANRVEVCGNLKFDISPPEEALTLGEALRKSWGKRFVFLAASTRDGEEEIILDLLPQMPELLLVIVPRHPQRFSVVEEMIRSRGLTYCKRSENRAPSLDTQVLLGDSMGEMFAYYSACDAAFVGGSLLPLGGQNLIEACSLGKPVIVGPHTFNFAEAASVAVEKGAAIRVRNGEELLAALRGLYENEEKRIRMGRAGLAFAEENRGAARAMLQKISAALD